MMHFSPSIRFQYREGAWTCGVLMRVELRGDRPAKSGPGLNLMERRWIFCGLVGWL